MLYQLLLLFSIFSTDDPAPAKIHPRIIEAKKFCKQNGYDTSVVFMIDFAIPNGRKRFFVCDLNTGAVLKSGLVTHGSCNTKYLSVAEFSNEPGCGCSSAGKYRIGGAYKGNFGDAYKLYGLDSTNSNAYNRYIVLHSHSCVPDNDIYPSQICNSQGCPTVSPLFLKDLQTILSQKKKPVLMWMAYRL